MPKIFHGPHKNPPPPPPHSPTYVMYGHINRNKHKTKKIKTLTTSKMLP